MRPTEDIYLHLGGDGTYSLKPDLIPGALVASSLNKFSGQESRCFELRGDVERIRIILHIDRSYLGELSLHPFPSVAYLRDFAEEISPRPFPSCPLFKYPSLPIRNQDRCKVENLDAKDVVSMGISFCRCLKAVEIRENEFFIPRNSEDFTVKFSVENLRVISQSDNCYNPGNP